MARAVKCCPPTTVVIDGFTCFANSTVLSTVNALQVPRPLGATMSGSAERICSSRDFQSSFSAWQSITWMSTLLFLDSK